MSVKFELPGPGTGIAIAAAVAIAVAGFADIYWLFRIVFIIIATILIWLTWKIEEMHVKARLKEKGIEIDEKGAITTSYRVVSIGTIVVAIVAIISAGFSPYAPELIRWALIGIATIFGGLTIVTELIHKK